MKKLKTLGVFILLTVSFLINGCKDEENGPIIEFASASSTVIEGEKLNINFNIPIPKGVFPKFSFSGTSKESTDYSYQISSDRTNLTIRTISDNGFEDETIIIELTSFSGGGALLGKTRIHTVAIKDPSLSVRLKWDVGNGTVGDVNMNLVLWKLNNDGTTFSYLKASDSNSSEEHLTLPATYSDAIYGLTYHYYSGTASQVKFTVTFLTAAGSIEGGQKQKSFTGTYTSVNKNTSYTVGIEQVLVKSVFHYNTFSEIVIPDVGSRVRNTIPYNLVEVP